MEHYTEEREFQVEGTARPPGAFTELEKVRDAASERRPATRLC